MHGEEENKESNQQYDKDLYLPMLSAAASGDTACGLGDCRGRALGEVACGVRCERARAEAAVDLHLQADRRPPSLSISMEATHSLPLR